MEYGANPKQCYRCDEPKPKVADECYFCGEPGCDACMAHQIDNEGSSRLVCEDCIGQLEAA
jgi:hypothetical protein